MKRMVMAAVVVGIALVGYEALADDGGDDNHRGEADKARSAADECEQFISEDCGS